MAGGLLVFLVFRFDVDLPATWQTIRSAHPGYLAAAVAVHYTTFMFRGARWRLLLRSALPGEPPAGVFYCSQLVLLGWFVNSIGWLRLGDAFRAYLYQEERRSTFFGAIGTILSERVLDILLIVALLLVIAPFLLRDGGGAAAWGLLLTAGALAAGMGLLLLALRRAHGRLLRWLPGWLAERYERFHQGATGSFGRWPLTTLLGLLAWLAEALRMTLVAEALGLDLGLPLLVFLTIANSLLTLVPTPGGLGAVESGVAGLATQMGRLAASSAAALILVDRAITYLSVIGVGAGLFLLRHLARRRAAAGGPG